MGEVQVGGDKGASAIEEPCHQMETVRVVEGEERLLAMLRGWMVTPGRARESEFVTTEEGTDEG